MNIDKQTEYWIAGAEDDLLTADILIKKERFIHGLFFCHLAVEKSLKAIYVKYKKSFAPKTHNLLYLCEITAIYPDAELTDFFAILMRYQISGRYPDNASVHIDTSAALSYLKQTSEAVEWLKEKLKQL